MTHGSLLGFTPSKFPKPRQSRERRLRRSVYQRGSKNSADLHFSAAACIIRCPFCAVCDDGRREKSSRRTRSDIRARRSSFGRVLEKIRIRRRSCIARTPPKVTAPLLCARPNPFSSTLRISNLWGIPRFRITAYNLSKPDLGTVCPAERHDGPIEPLTPCLSSRLFVHSAR